MSLAGILQSYVRAGWLAVSLAIFIVILLTPAARRHGLRLVLVVAVLLALFGGQLINSRAIENRLSAEGSIDFRKEAAQAGIQIAARAPILGLGLDNFGEGAAETDWAFGRSIGVRLGAWTVAPHNFYLYVLISAGLVGLLPFLLLLGSIGWLGLRGWYRAGRSPDGDQGRWAAMLGTLVAYAVFSYTFDSVHAQLASIFLFLVVGAVLAPQATSPLEAQA
jgi:O-antigen ligase